MKNNGLILASLLGLLAFLTLSKQGQIITQQIGDFIVRISQSGLDLIKSFEGFSATPYADASGQSIGFGHFILPGESFPSAISEAQATDILLSDSAKAQKAISDYVTVPLNQNQYDALTSFIFNVGVYAFANSTLLRVLNTGDYVGAAGEFQRWNKSGGVVNDALVQRRAAEATLFLGA